MNYQNSHVTKTIVDDGYKLAAIDALRGWAILFVIVAHTADGMPNLSWHVKKVTSMGWYGVQLFFIMSAFTLLMSWQRQTNLNFGKKCLKFFIRRFFRIAPMYYTGAVLYLMIRPPGNLFSIEQLFINLLFINSWSPLTMPTVDNIWQVVPGGWSIGVEFSFYILFPILAILCQSLKNGLIFALVSCILGSLSYYCGNFFYGNLYPPQAVDNYLFFWLPNQLFVFALGFILYYTNKNKIYQINKLSSHLKYLIIIFLTISQLEIHKHFSTTAPFIPKHFIVSIIFFMFSNHIINFGNKFLINKLIIKLGQVSFSAYVLHFAIIQFFHNFDIINSSGWQAIYWYTTLTPTILTITLLTSISTFKLIEKPFINLSRNITRKL